MPTYTPAPPPENEERRLATLYAYGLLDTSSEPLFDSLTQLAAQICGTPISVIALIDRDRQWFKAVTGLAELRQIPREQGLCSHVVFTDGIVEIPDASADERFAHNPLVQQFPHVRFYAGVPLRVASGDVLGTLCVIDRQPGTLSIEQRAGLRSVAATVVEGFEWRRAFAGRPAASAARKDGPRARAYAAALALTDDAVAIATAGATLDEAGTIVYVNDAYLRATGAHAGDVIGKPDDVLLGPETDRTTIAGLRRAVYAGDAAAAAYVAYRIDGSHYRCRTQARLVPAQAPDPAHVVFVQRTAPERSFELLDERLVTLTHIARKLLGSLEPLGLVESLVEGVRELTGGGKARLLARGTSGEFIATHDLSSRAAASPEEDDFVRAAVRHDGVLLSPDKRRGGVVILAPSGEIGYVLDITAAARPFSETDAFAFGLLGHYLAVAIRNVELYGELALRRAAVVELNQVKDDLIAMLAHDFKGPLTTIVGLADVLAQDARFDAESRQYLEMINSSAMRLAGLATDTLTLSRLEEKELSLRFERVDVVALVKDIARVLGVTRAIAVRAGTGELIVRADAARLRQVFENLIGNAIKYSPRGDQVDVFVGAASGGVEVAIRDRGIGIPAADLAKLFGRFARGSNARRMGIGGTGFGLYLARTIVEMHGGSIAVDTKEGSGSTFRVLVPSVPAPQRTLERRVLLLDSEEDHRSFIASTLRDEGYTVIAVADETELLHSLDDGRYDAAIVDTTRLVMAADELVELIAHRTTLVRLVTTPESESSGWNAALRKPFLMRDLQVVLESAVAERRRYPRAGAQAQERPGEGSADER